MQNSEEYFFEYIRTENIYTADEYCIPPFWDFMYRIQALHRYWAISSRFWMNHLKHIQNAEDINGRNQEFYDLHDETVGSDKVLIPEILKKSVLLELMDSLDGLLNQLYKEIARDLNLTSEFLEPTVSLMDKQLFSIAWKLNIHFPVLNTIEKLPGDGCEITTHLNHIMSNDIKKLVKFTLEEFMQDLNALVLEDEIVELAFERVSNVVKALELAYIESYRPGHMNE